MAYRKEKDLLDDLNCEELEMMKDTTRKERNERIEDISISKNCHLKRR